MRVIRRSALVLAAVAALAVPAGVASAAPAKPTTPAAQLLLTQGEFPAGYQVEKLSAAELKKVTAGVGDVFASAKATPAHCLPTINRGALDQAAGMPLVVALNEAKRTGISEMLSSRSADSATAIAAGCEKVRIETAVGPSGKDRVVMDITSTPITLPGAPAGSKTVLVRSTGTATVDGKPEQIRQEQIIGADDVRGYGVLMVGTAVAGNGGSGASVDRAGFAQALTKAVDKVRTAK